MIRPVAADRWSGESVPASNQQWRKSSKFKQPPDDFHVCKASLNLAAFGAKRTGATRSKTCSRAV